MRNASPAANVTRESTPDLELVPERPVTRANMRLEQGARRAGSGQEKQIKDGSVRRITFQDTVTWGKAYRRMGLSALTKARACR
jgi:hypothetical protein